MSYSKEIDWNDGSGDKLYFSAPASEGDQIVEVSSDANAGEERRKTVNFVATGVTPQPLTIVQLGSGASFDDWIKDGDTHLWINIVDDTQCEQNLRIRLKGTIDWGDGSTKETANVTTYTTFTHTYPGKGKYRIDLHPTSGTFYLGGASSSYNVMGSRSGSAYGRNAVLYQAEVGTSIITTISTYAFAYCSGLRTVYVPKTITTVGTYAFYSSRALTEVIFEDASTLTSTGTTGLFYGCFGLQQITTFERWATATGLNQILRDCYSLMRFTIPATVTSIAANTFNNAYSIRILNCLPTTAPTVADANAFTNFSSVAVIRVPYGSLSSYQGASIWSTYSSQMEEGGLVTYTLSHVTSSNKDRMVASGSTFTTTLTADEGYTLGTVTVKMGGTDITNTVYSNGVVSIASVTGNIVITATGT